MVEAVIVEFLIISFGRLLHSTKLDVPADKILLGTTTIKPHVFIGDEHFLFKKILWDLTLGQVLAT